MLYDWKQTKTRVGSFISVLFARSPHYNGAVGLHMAHKKMYILITLLNGLYPALSLGFILVKTSTSAYSGELQQSDRCPSWSSRSEWHKTFLTSVGIIYILSGIKCRNQINGWKSTAALSRTGGPSFPTAVLPVQPSLISPVSRTNRALEFLSVTCNFVLHQKQIYRHTMCGKYYQLLIQFIAALVVCRVLPPKTWHILKLSLKIQR